MSKTWTPNEKDIENSNINEAMSRVFISDYKKFYEGVYRSIVVGERVPVSSDDGIKVMKVIEAAFQSDAEQTAIKLT